jgi:hypothetical protein
MICDLADHTEIGRSIIYKYKTDNRRERARTKNEKDETREEGRRGRKRKLED